jgi:hypothetical protein
MHNSTNISINNRNKAVALFIMFCLFTVSNIFAKQVVHLIEDKNDCIVLKFELPKYSVNDVIVNGKKCQSVTAPGASYLSEKGAPQLPRFTQSIILPDNVAMGLEIIDFSYREIIVNKIVPSRGAIYCNQDPVNIPYVFGDVYGKNVWYPKMIASLSKPFILRDIRGAVVYFYPFQYNPVQGKIKVAESITIKVKPAAGPVINPLYSSDKTISSAFKKLYQRRFINFENNAVRYPEVNDGEKMVVISAADYKISMEPFVEWKNRKGIKTELYEYPVQTGGSGADLLKNFIQQIYDNDTITYILLVGDADDIPTLEGTIDGLSDPSFVKLAGNDHYPDAFIGRFCVGQAAHADNMVDKLLNYEKEPDPNGEWYSKAIGMACDMDGGTGVSDEEWIEDMSLVMLNSMYTHVDRVFESQNGTTAQVSAALNEGRGWFNYQGHGTQTEFGFLGGFVKNGTFLQLQNTYKLPVIICVACNTGEFDFGTDCIAELSTKLEKTGAIVFFGSYVKQPFEPPQHGQKEIVRLLAEDSYISVGAIVYNGGSKILEVGNSAGEYLETFETWILFGDPSLLAFNSKPSTMNVTCPEAIDTGTQEVEIGFGDGIEGRVCLFSEKHGILASKIVSNSATEKLTVQITDEKKIYLTITARNRMPIMKEITIGTIGIKENNPLVNKNRCIVKKFGNSLMVRVPFDEKGILTVSDLKGRSLVEFKTNTSAKWYQIPEYFSSSMYIISIMAHKRVFTRKFCFIR